MQKTRRDALFLKVYFDVMNQDSERLHLSIKQPRQHKPLQLLLYIDRARLKSNNISSKLLSFFKVPPEKLGELDRS